MLVSLTVHHLALVDEAEVTFSPGLNVITGETGAGKSVLMGALSLVMGNRADKELIRTGERECQAQAVFQLDEGNGVHGLLAEQELPACEDGQLIVRRVVREGGAGKQFVNDAPVTLQTLKGLGRNLVDMHGPHDHQSLFDTSFQRDLLDDYGKHTKANSEYVHVYHVWQEAMSRKRGLEGTDEGIAEQIDLMSFRVRELEEAALSTDEEEVIREEHQVLGHAQEIQSLGQAIILGLMEGEGSSFDSLAGVLRHLEDLIGVHPEAGEWNEEARAISVQIQELHRTISSALQSVEADPARLQWLDDRLAVYQKMLRKYGPGISDVLQELEMSRSRLADLSSRDQRLAEINREIDCALDAVSTKGQALHEARAKTAKRLARDVTGNLQALGFSRGEFFVDVQVEDPGPSGVDRVEYGFAPNTGEAMRPLRSIASSGEISRVMLATKRVLAKLDRIPVLVFDEIDANIGGEIANVVGGQLAELSQYHQVLCITHLPQVAVCGQAHYAVTKTESAGRTFTAIRHLDDISRAEEIARMLGGKNHTTVTLDHAKQMLKKARENG